MSTKTSNRVTPVNTPVPVSNYPHVGIRLSRDLNDRVRALASRMTKDLHRPVGISEIIVTCIVGKLPDIEAKHTNG